ncbi:post-GPI attachment to proteins factor 3 [Aricia agestis]|uniref:post-GPI attachment to proteins factor 3 n=1 Tax=Aricia agestis TaxID=91739 RepID=UPI001C20A003|nr:post-GPI attachment to proteins factor 3 [Aricia agestis]
MVQTEILLFLSLFSYGLCSEGDRSPYYQNCLRECVKNRCTSGVVKKATKDIPPIPALWSCGDNCRYYCMFDTVDRFEERGFQIPKFHGKWPIRRVFGIQEPASVFGSILNLVANAYMYSKMRSKFPVRTMPVVLFWHAFAWICMNAWVWSIVFHTRDVYFTEFMDYAGALSMVMSLFVAAVIRAFYRAKKLVTVIILATLLYYAEHVRYLYSGRIDYDYNMHVNLFFGVVGSLIWILWAGREWAAGRRHAWWLLAFTALSAAALTLEVFDFPPKYYAWDAHALWHLSTAPLPLLFYRFVIDDLNYIRTSSSIEKSNIKLP